MRWLVFSAALAGCTAHNPAVDDLGPPDDLSMADAISEDSAVDAAPDFADAAANPCAGMADGTSCGTDRTCRAGLCAPTTCGNHLVDPGEECDDQNLVSGDGCEADCRFSCHAADDCDDGNACNGSESCSDHSCQKGAPISDGSSCGMSGSCRGGLCAPASCGDRVLDSGEECDDQNLVAGDGCEADCRFSCHLDADCSDGNACNGSETCSNHACARGAPLSDGSACANGGTCRARTCAAANCGNHVLDPGEECDDQNLVSGDGCEPDCRFSCHLDADCSDGDPCDGSESCSNHLCTTTAPLGDGTPCGGGRSCRGKLCAPATCGDKMVEVPEECDDQNLVSGDGCENDCNFSCQLDQQCNDVNPCNGVERCAVNHACQGGAPPAQGTVCDADSNAATRDLCLNGACAASACGDGFVDGTLNEQCDDHNLGRLDGCDSACRVEQSQRITSFAFQDDSQGCTNLDGDPAIDNALGGGLSGTSLSLLNSYVSTGLNGTNKHLIYLADLDDLLGQNDPSLRLGFIDGLPNLGGFTGMKGEAFSVSGADVDAMGLPKSLLFPAAVVGGGLSAGPGAAPLALSVFGNNANLVLRRAFAAVTTDNNLMRIDSLGSGILCGTISAGDLDKLPTPTEIDIACPKYSSGSLLDLLVGGCNLGGVSVTATQPDMDLGGDGFGSLADTNNDGIIDTCSDGSGTVITGNDCAQDARFDDAYSFAASFASVRVQIVRIR
jgi:cysteine-rich repeat protein